MKKIKILYTIPNFDTAGSGKVLYDLAKNLNPSQFEVHIACSHPKGDFFAAVEKLGLPIHLVETTCELKPYHTILKRIRPYKKFVKEHQFDIVHSWHWSSDWTEVLGAKLGGAKFVFTKKAMAWGNKHWKIRSFLADYIITINEEMKAYFPYKRAQQLIPIGLDTEHYSSVHFAKPELTNQFTIITVANLVPVKGIEVLIEAVLRLNNPKIQLQILGDDRNEYATNLKQRVAERTAEEQIFFLGKHQEVRPFLVAADLYVIPTRNEGRKEGMPMALVEAMSMEIPVLGSNVSGINFVLKAFQELLFEAANSEELALKIKDMVDKTKEERQQIGNELRKYVRNNFSLQQSIAAHETLYRKLLNK